MSDISNQLNVVLAETYALYLKTQNYHWNVEGERFDTLHKLFQEQYEELREAVDDIAERLRAIGEKAPGSFGAYGKLSQVEDGNENFSENEMIADLHDTHVHLAGTVKKLLDMAGQAGDDVTEDMMIARLTVHDKTAWMLRSSLPEDFRAERNARLAA